MIINIDAGELLAHLPKRTAADHTITVELKNPPITVLFCDFASDFQQTREKIKGARTIRWTRVLVSVFCHSHTSRIAAASRKSLIASNSDSVLKYNSPLPQGEMPFGNGSLLQKV
ncbi:MAG: hypothetical protein FJ308_23445 [Planctomycetes bacterium]|nr:hypothetical protein [Planctomycetota bacterium]